MNAKITFEGPLPFIQQLVEYAAELDEEYTQGDGQIVSTPPLPSGTVVKFSPTVPTTAQPNGVAPTGTPAKKRESAAEKKARLEREAIAAQPAVEPNAAANAAIAQQSQWAQQPNYPQQPQGFPSAAVNTAPATPFAPPATTQPGVGTAGQAWLAPQAVNAPAGPTLEQVYQLLSTHIANDTVKRTLFSNWMFHKQIGNLEDLKDQPQALAEAYGVASKIISGEIQPV